MEKMTPWRRGDDSLEASRAFSLWGRQKMASLNSIEFARLRASKMAFARSPMGFVRYLVQG